MFEQRKNWTDWDWPLYRTLLVSQIAADGSDQIVSVSRNGALTDIITLRVAPSA